MRGELFLILLYYPNPSICKICMFQNEIKHVYILQEAITFDFYRGILFLFRTTWKEYAIIRKLHQVSSRCQLSPPANCSQIT